MDEIKKMMFQMQRFQILALFTNKEAARNVTASYAFAWQHGVYPLLNESAPWHKNYSDLFEIKEEQLDEIHRFLSQRCDSNQLITFYELEDHYKVRSSHPENGWNRSSLLAACRYMQLCDNFGSDFWSALTENGKCPSEAHSITRKFVEGDVYFE